MASGMTSLPLALSDSVSDWADLGLRWLHVVAAMTWNVWARSWPANSLTSCSAKWYCYGKPG